MAARCRGLHKWRVSPQSRRRATPGQAVSADRSGASAPAQRHSVASRPKPLAQPQGHWTMPPQGCSSIRSASARRTSRTAWRKRTSRRRSCRYATKWARAAKATANARLRRMTLGWTNRRTRLRTTKRGKSSARAWPVSATTCRPVPRSTSSAWALRTATIRPTRHFPRLAIGCARRRISTTNSCGKATTSLPIVPA